MTHDGWTIAEANALHAALVEADTLGPAAPPVATFETLGALLGRPPCRCDACNAEYEREMRTP